LVERTRGSLVKTVDSGKMPPRNPRRVAQRQDKNAAQGFATTLVISASTVVFSTVLHQRLACL